jgi:hypothetical protein
MITRRQFMTGLVAGVALGSGFSGYAFAVEPRFRLVVTEWDLPTRKMGPRPSAAHRHPFGYPRL